MSENGLVMVGMEESAKASIVGDLDVTVIKAEGKEYDMTLTKVKYIPGFKVNLISLTRYMFEGWSLVSNAKSNISLTKRDNSVAFDRKIVTGAGIVLGIRVKRRTPPDLSALVMGRRQDINLWHGALGHAAEASVRATAALLGVTLTGSFAKCEPCAITKVRQKNVPKAVVSKTQKPGELMFFDISSINTTSLGGSKYLTFIRGSLHFDEVERVPVDEGTIK